MKNSSKPRVLYLMRILYEETDDTTGLTLPEIQAKLADVGIMVERKALYRDFSALAEAGIPLGKHPTRPVSYYLKERLFDTTQLMLLIDAVQTSKSITKSNSLELIRTLKKLASKQEARTLDARVHVAGRVKMQNESIFRTLDLIQKAIAEKRDISFDYMHYDVNKKLRDSASADGKPRIKTPLHIIYSNDNYYLLVYDENSADHVRVYRIDRMHNVMLREKSDKAHALDPSFSVADYEQNTLGMFDGKKASLVLEASEEVISNVLDIFGPAACSVTPAHDVRECDGEGGLGDTSSQGCEADHNSQGNQGVRERQWAHIRVKTVVNPVLFGLLAQFGGDVRIKFPQAVREEFKKHLLKTLDAQDRA